MTTLPTWPGPSLRPRGRTLAATVAGVTAAAAVGTSVTDPQSRWYRGLDLPPWQPPGIAFPVVWTGLYASIAGATASAYDRFRAQGRPADAAGLARALGVNLVLNAGWSVVFFGLERPRAAVPVAAALAASSVDLARRAGAADRRLGWALAPYAAWTSFATVLNAEIARRNP